MAYQYPFIGAPDDLLIAIWQKGFSLDGETDSQGRSYSPAIWRRDMCGSAMKFSEHGNRGSKYGWEIDHIMPTAKGGSDTLDNLQPLCWKNNASKGDTYPWDCF